MACDPDKKKKKKTKNNILTSQLSISGSDRLFLLQALWPPASMWGTVHPSRRRRSCSGPSVRLHRDEHACFCDEPVNAGAVVVGPGALLRVVCSIPCLSLQCDVGVHRKDIWEDHTWQNYRWVSSGPCVYMQNPRHRCSYASHDLVSNKSPTPGRPGLHHVRSDKRCTGTHLGVRGLPLRRRYDANYVAVAGCAYVALFPNCNPKICVLNSSTEFSSSVSSAIWMWPGSV